MAKIERIMLGIAISIIAWNIFDIGDWEVYLIHLLLGFWMKIFNE